MMGENTSIVKTLPPTSLRVVLPSMENKPSKCLKKALPLSLRNIIDNYKLHLSSMLILRPQQRRLRSVNKMMASHVLRRIKNMSTAIFAIRFSAAMTTSTVSKWKFIAVRMLLTTLWKR